jgi:hypothetical protein
MSITQPNVVGGGRVLINHTTSLDQSWGDTNINTVVRQTSNATWR